MSHLETEYLSKIKGLRSPQLPSVRKWDSIPQVGKDQGNKIYDLFLSTPQIAEAVILLRTAVGAGSNALRPHEEEVQIPARSYGNGGISDEGIQKPHEHTIIG